MALKPGDRKNFETLQKAFAAGDVALVECTDAKTGEYRAVVCLLNQLGDEIQIIPVCHLCTGNPFEEYKEPLP